MHSAPEWKTSFTYVDAEDYEEYVCDAVSPCLPNAHPKIWPSLTRRCIFLNSHCTKLCLCRLRFSATRSFGAYQTCASLSTGGTEPGELLEGYR